MKTEKCPDCGCEFTSHPRAKPKPKLVWLDRVVDVFFYGSIVGVGLLFLVFKFCGSNYCGG